MRYFSILLLVRPSIPIASNILINITVHHLLLVGHPPRQHLR